MKTNKRKRVMRTICTIVIMICLLVLVSECDNLMVFVVSKLIAGGLLVVFGNLFAKVMTDEELNEKV